MSRDIFHANGIDGATGSYLLPALTPARLAALVRGEPLPDTQRELVARSMAAVAHYGVPDGTDPDDLADTGWGIVFAAGADAAVRAALAPLIELRRTQAAAKKESRFKIFDGEKGYRAGLSKNQFLLANGAAPGEVDPDKIPYYLLLVGSPGEIPFSFQYQLDVQHAVGRLDLATPGDYARYAQSVVAAEQGTLTRARRLAMFGPRHPDDDATALSADVLLSDLREAFATPAQGWSVASTVGADASKVRLAQLLGGAETPALLFTASHGVGFPNGHAQQLACQGALLTQDWQGPLEHRGPLQASQYFAAADLGATAQGGGLVAFCFACYGAGTPQRDEFTRGQGSAAREIAPRPFTAPLARALLGHPNGAALAFIGHVERAWGYSFYWPEAGAATRVFRDALKRMIAGRRIGFALEPFNDKHAALAVDVKEMRDQMDEGMTVDEAEFASLWTANNDARNYAILGDPAARLATESP